MSWIEKIQSDYIIRTGDGREYRPLWVNAQKQYDFNVSEFEFIGQRGAKVVRDEVKARRFNLTLYFEGENVLDISDNFERSSFDKRPWVITHPMYGQITVQPLGINFDNSQLNITTITSTVIETLLDNFPQTNDEFVDIIAQRAELTNEAFASSLEGEDLSSSDLQEVSQQQRKLFVRGQRLATGIDAETYFNAFNTANNSLFISQNNPIQSIIDTQNFILAPARFVQSTRLRVELIRRQIQELFNFAPRATNRGKKMIFQNNTGTLITAQCLSLSTPVKTTDAVTAVDFQTSMEVLNYAQELNQVYNDYISELNDLQTNDGGELQSYIPSYEPLAQLADLVNYTISNLLNIAVNSKVQRTLILNYATNAIELTHRLYGLDVDDINLNQLIDQNDLSFDEYLSIPANKKIVYFI